MKIIGYTGTQDELIDKTISEAIDILTEEHEGKSRFLSRTKVLKKTVELLGIRDILDRMDNEYFSVWEK